MGTVIEFPRHANTTLPPIESRLKSEGVDRRPEAGNKEGIVQVYHRLMMESLNLETEKGMKFYEHHLKKWLKARDKKASRLIQYIQLVLKLN